MKTRIENLRIGQRVDLEGDLFADTLYYEADDPGASDHPEFQFEWETVAAIERETGECIRVDFASGFSCGFPPDHEVDIDGEQTFNEEK
jgi:hypothetical protein